MDAPSFNGTALTPATLAATREWFAGWSRELIADIEAGRRKVNNPESYITFHRKAIQDVMDESNPRLSYTFLQRAYWIQTGEDVALLP